MTSTKRYHVFLSHRWFSTHIIDLWDLSNPAAPVQLGEPLLGYAGFRYVTKVVPITASSCQSSLVLPHYI